tara:strand:+ start:177 stop:398 length:222 start_codon:yes stop_codon:yes gene_type:complete
MFENYNREIEEPKNNNLEENIQDSEILPQDEVEEDDLLLDRVDQLEEDFETIKGNEIPSEYLDRDHDWYDYGN